jgi:hypothetical protein
MKTTSAWANVAQRCAFVALMTWTTIACTNNTGDGGEGEGEGDEGGSEGEGEGDDTPLCTGGVYAAPEVAGTLGPALLVELSGLARSRINPDRLYAHNDGDAQGTLFQIGVDGRGQGTVRLPMMLVDVEDVAVADCPAALAPAASCVYLADTGNNFGDRSSLSIHVFAEPTSNDVAAADVVSIRIPLAGDTNELNVEAMLVASTRVVLIEKTLRVNVRMFAMDVNEVQPTLRLLASVLAPPGGSNDQGRAVTAVALHPSGRRVALRTYSGIFEAVLEGAQGLDNLGDAVVSPVIHEPAIVGDEPTYEPQGEAIVYVDTDLYTASEDREGLPGQPLHRFRCLDAAP